MKGKGESVETVDIGKRIKSIRKRKNLTLQEVSETSGMSATAISAIERNVSSPTVNTLAAIGRALGESLSSLLGEVEIDYVVTRAADREQLATALPGIDFQSLAAGVPGRRFHPKHCILKAGANSGEDFINPQGRRILLRDAGSAGSGTQRKFRQDRRGRQPLRPREHVLPLEERARSGGNATPHRDLLLTPSERTPSSSRRSPVSTVIRRPQEGASLRGPGDSGSRADRG